MPESPSFRGVRSWGGRLTVVVLVLEACWLVWAAGRYSVFDDEAFSCQRYTLPMPSMIGALERGEEPDPPLYYVLQNGWVRLFGVSPLPLRGLSIACFLVGLVLVRLAAQAAFGATAGVVAMVLAGLHPAHLLLGMSARWYSLFFTVSALLLYFSARLERRRGASAGRARSSNLEVLCWSVAAAALCYTNYFGPVVVACVWLIVLVRAPVALWQWLPAGLLSLALYVPWLRPTFKMLIEFPQAGGESGRYWAAAARPLMALAAGNLASVRCAWIWLPLAISAALVGVLIIRRWSSVGPIAVLVLVILGVGIGARVLIDKYVMLLTAPACLLVAAVLAGDRSPEPARDRGVRVMAAGALAVGWLGCYVNLATERNWSSLRWLDPFERVIEDAAASGVLPCDWVATHPSVKYYAVRRAVMAAPGGHRTPADRRPLINWHGVSARDWLARLLPASFEPRSRSVVMPPGAVAFDSLYDDPPERLLTIEASQYSRSSDWDYLRAGLARYYELRREMKYLEDPEAELKDRVDPQFVHPRWRITLRVWHRRE